MITQGKDISLAGSSGTDEHNFTPGKILNDTHPRHGNNYFDTSLFTRKLGTNRKLESPILSWPGSEQLGHGARKEHQLQRNEIARAPFRSFNAFNHAQFQNPSGSIDSSSFGSILAANEPRVLQIGAKVHF